MHDTLTRFDPRSELSRLNADPRDAVPASRLLCRLAALVPYAGELSDGLVDATQLDALEVAGYVASLRGKPRPELAVPAATPRPALADPRRRWAGVSADLDARVIHRPAGTRIDSGGLAKGLAADLVADLLGDHDAFAVSCLGDVRVGGQAGRIRPVEIADPFGSPRPVVVLRLRAGAVATSGVTARGNHIIDPGRGLPAWTGIVQASAVAPTATEAEVRAKAALLAGPDRAHAYLPHGGVLVLADGSVIEHATAAYATVP
jgi:thiamine biosynthesis lipoprotein